MKGIQRKRRNLLLTGFLALLIAARLSGPYQAQAHSPERLKEQRLIDQSEPLFQTVAPTVERQTLAVDFSTPLFLSITSQDTAGHDVATVTWNVPRNAVCDVLANPAYEGMTRKHRLSSPEIVWRTRSWLIALGLVPDTRRWRPTGAPIALQRYHCMVNWTGEGRRATVEIDDCSGALYHVSVRSH